jgi:hypothetical protein
MKNRIDETILIEWPYTTTAFTNPRIVDGPEALLDELHLPKPQADQNADTFVVSVGAAGS